MYIRIYIYLIFAIAQLEVSVLNDSMLTVPEGAEVKICLMLNRMGGVTGVNVSYTITGDTSGELVCHLIF